MNAGDVKVRLVADLKRFSGNMTKATGLVRGFASIGSKSVGLLTRSLRSLTGLPALGVGAMFAGSVAQIAKFQEQMGFVSTMLDEQSMKLMPQYEKAVRSLAVQFGEGTETISRGLYQTLSASIAPAKAIDFLTVSMKAAKAGMTDTETAADTLSTMLNAYGYNAEYAGLMSDRLFGIVKRGKTTFPELASSLGNVASSAALVGMNVETMGAALSTMTRSGLATSEAVTALNRLLVSFNKPKGKAVSIAAQFDVEMKAASVSGNGLIEVVKKFRKAFDEGRMTSEDLAQIVTRETGYKALSILIQHVTEVERDYAEMMNSVGSTEEQAAKATANLMHRLRQMWQLLIAISRTAIEPFADDLADLSDYIVANREEITAWVGSVSSALRRVGALVSGNFTQDINTAFATIKEIAITTGKAILITMEETFKFIGRNLVPWIWDGITSAGLSLGGLRKRIIEGLATSAVKEDIIDEWKDMVPKLQRQRYVEAGGKFDYETTEQKGAGTLDAYTRTETPRYPEEWEKAKKIAEEQAAAERDKQLLMLKGNKVSEDAGELQAAIGERLKTLYSDMEKRLEAMRIKVPRVSAAWENLKDNVKALADAFKGSGWTPGMEEFIGKAKELGGAFENAGTQIWDAIKGVKTQFPERAAAPQPATDADARTEEAAKIVDDYVQSLRGEVDVIRLLVGGYKAEAEWQEIVNQFKQQGVKLTDAEIETIQRLQAAQAKTQADQTVQEHVQRLQDEVDVLGLLAAGYKSEAKEQGIVNEFKAQGIALTGSQIQMINRLQAAQEKARGDETVGDYIDTLRDEVAILRLLAAGYESEAEKQRIVNQFKRQGIVLTTDQIATIEDLVAAQKRLAKEVETQAAPTKWAAMWEDAAGTISGAMEDAFVSITKDAKNASEAIENMAAAMQEAISRSVFQQYMMPGINKMIGGVLGQPTYGSTVQQAPTVQQGSYTSGVDPGGEMSYPSRGGLVKGFALGGLVKGGESGGIVYASRGKFTPRGTDTVPAMLTPGEGVLDRDTTARLRRILEVPEAPSMAAGRPINISVNAIDAAGTYQFLQKNKRALASMMGNATQANHPSTRSKR